LPPLLTLLAHHRRRHPPHPALLPLPTRRSSDLTWRTSPRPSPQETRPRAREVVQCSRSLLVYPTTVGFPVVPEETWYRTRSSWRSEEHTSELQSRENLVCRLLLEKKKLRSESIY